MGTNEMTNEGVRVGELLLGAINDNSPVMLWTVTRVIGKSKVEAVAATREFELKITVSTRQINDPSYDHQMLRVRYVPSEESIAGLKRLGSLVKR
jgi:hypothetical protein